MSVAEFTCTAPSCSFVALYDAKGEDFDGTPFQERVCQRCANYLTAAAAECGKPLTLDRIRIPFVETPNA